MIFRTLLVSYYSLFTQLPFLLAILSQQIFPNMVIILHYYKVSLPLFCECMTIFVTVAKYLAPHFKKELELFFEKVVFHYLGNISIFHQIDHYLMEKVLLESLIDIFNEPLALELFFRNYDCDVYSLNLVSILLSILFLIPFSFLFYRYMKRSNIIIQQFFLIIRVLQKR